MKKTATFLGALVGLAAIISSSQVAAAPALAKSSNVCVSASPPPGVTIHSIYQNGNSWSIKYTYEDRYGARSTRTKDGISPSLQAFSVGPYFIRLRWSPCSVVDTPLTRGEMEAIGIIVGATSGNYVATSGSQLSGFNSNMQGNAATAAPNQEATAEQSTANGPLIKATVKGYLGISIAPVGEDLADALGLEKNRGEFVARVVAGEGADKAGLKEGDIILRVNDRPVTPETTVSSIVTSITPGTQIPLYILRQGKLLNLTATIGKRPAE